MATRISYQEIYPRLKGLLASMKNMPTASEIYADDALDDTGLGFTLQGLRRFANDLNHEFSAYGIAITADQTGKAKVVRDLAVLVYEAANA